MRFLTLLLLTACWLVTTAGAQESDLVLNWEPTAHTVSAAVELSGTANIPDQQFFFVEAAPFVTSADAKVQWRPVTLPQSTPVVDGALGIWDTALFPDGFYQLRLHAVNSSRESFYYFVMPIAIDNPVFIAPAADAGSVKEGMIPSPPVDNRLPIPVGGHVLHFEEAAQSAMKSAGMTWVKWQIPYDEGGDLTVARHRINVSHEAGFLVLLSVTGDKDALGQGGDPYLDGYAAFLGEVAALGADAIEVWNEMNLYHEWPVGQIDPNMYARMLEKAYRAIKTANPDTMVITGALAPTGAEGAFGLARVWNDDRYYAGMARAGVADFADCIGVHYNEGILPPSAQGGDPRADDYPTRYLPLMLKRVEFPFRNIDIPMCMTEMGYLSPEGYGPLSQAFSWAAYTSVEEHAQWLAQAIEISANFRDMPLELIIIWNVDFDNYGNDPQAGYAIIRPDGSCPACDTIAALQR